MGDIDSDIILNFWPASLFAQVGASSANEEDESASQQRGSFYMACKHFYHIDRAHNFHVFSRKQNALRNMAMKGRKVKEHFAWLWRCAFDATHGRLSAKKPFLTTPCDMKLPAKQPIKVTCDEAAAATA